MTARHYYRFDQDEAVAEVTGVLRWAYTGTQKAEEGEAGTYEIVVDDPEMVLDFVGHRRWTVYEDESDDDNEVIIDGLTQAVKVAHTGADIENPTGRVWTIEIADMNTLWTYRVMTGGDAKFPEQSDVERMQQLADSEEMGYFSDLSFLFTGSPVQMDKLDGRGQTTGQIADQCAQQSGKNWYIYSYGVHGEYSADFGLWYGKDSRTEYESPLSLSNDPAALDMAAVDDWSATLYPIGSDTVLRRDYARQYDGAYGEYQNGAKYVRNPAVSELITVTHRDMNHPAPEIKTAARMTARLTRVLLDHATPDEVISTTIVLPPNKVSSVRPGMRIEFTGLHLPNYEEPRFLRIMTASYKPIGRLYEVALELQGPGVAIPGDADQWFIVDQAVDGGNEQIGFNGVTVDGTYYQTYEVPPLSISPMNLAYVQTPGEMFYYNTTGHTGWNFGQSISDGGAITGIYHFPIGGGVGNTIVIGPLASGQDVTLHTMNAGTPYPAYAGATYSVYHWTPNGESPAGVPIYAGSTVGAAIATGVLAGDDTTWTVP